MPLSHRIIIATHNPGKKRELSEMLGERWSVSTLDDFPATEEPVEDGATFLANADIKSVDIWRQLQALGVDTKGAFIVADDSGIEVDALDGRPGVHSARYSGVPERGANRDETNNRKLLTELAAALAKAPEKGRGAQLRTVLSVVRDGRIVAHFESICPGSIAAEPRGANGYAYDPLFIPEGETRTFGEMESAEKNNLSMRARAASALAAWLENDQPVPRLDGFAQLGPRPSHQVGAPVKDGAAGPAPSPERSGQ